MAKLLAIGEAARELGVSAPTLRVWERKGHVKAIRLPSGYRRFTREEVDRVKREMGLLPPEESPEAAPKPSE